MDTNDATVCKRPKRADCKSVPFGVRVFDSHPSHQNQDREIGRNNNKMSTDKKNPEFTFHLLNDLGKSKAKSIQGYFDACLNGLTQVCPEGRYLAISKTKLEEACFFAKKAMATHPENQEF